MDLLDFKPSVGLKSPGWVRLPHSPAKLSEIMSESKNQLLRNNYCEVTARKVKTDTENYQFNVRKNQIHRYKRVGRFVRGSIFVFGALRAL